MLSGAALGQVHRRQRPPASELGLGRVKMLRWEGVRHRQHPHAGAPPEAAASVLVNDYRHSLASHGILVAQSINAIGQAGAPGD